VLPALFWCAYHQHGARVRLLRAWGGRTVDDDQQAADRGAIGQ
jgi:hypothetical protein